MFKYYMLLIIFCCYVKLHYFTLLIFKVCLFSNISLIFSAKNLCSKCTFDTLNEHIYIF